MFGYNYTVSILMLIIMVCSGILLAIIIAAIYGAQKKRDGYLQQIGASVDEICRIKNDELKRINANEEEERSEYNEDDLQVVFVNNRVPRVLSQNPFERVSVEGYNTSMKEEINLEMEDLIKNNKVVAAEEPPDDQGETAEQSLSSVETTMCESISRDKDDAENGVEIFYQQLEDIKSDSTKEKGDSEAWTGTPASFGSRTCATDKFGRTYTEEEIANCIR